MNVDKSLNLDSSTKRSKNHESKRLVGRPKKNKTSISTASISNSDINLNETIRDSQPTTSSKNIKNRHSNRVTKTCNVRVMVTGFVLESKEHEVFS